MFSLKVFKNILTIDKFYKKIFSMKFGFDENYFKVKW